ncbi:LysR family transcriptional regulator [Seohaeicola zhoushanensis]|uniref:Transcriptional regulator n=1 Tax=Seohaeicola zhoushanensis TaxID=1569283 RepID=A0A8J3M837_9RHOB|nr:LysR family transcriptional regulator [Seohaeicola zhoushanensis]GHF57101.1 transcriptional regulator [Seohaeicola zhoushanensis]
MLSRNLRHFRVFLAVADLKSPTLAADRCHVTQPAVTQALGKLEREAGGALFDRTRQGFFLTPRGEVFETRIRRAIDRLDAALAEIAPRLTLTASAAQLQAMIAVSEAQTFSLAARTLGIAQPTVHRAVTRLEKDAARPLFDRVSFGLAATRACRALVQAARLAFSEVEQAEAELAAFDGREVGRIVVGALPLSRSVVLPEALARFRAARPRQPVTILDGPYTEMLSGLRRGDIDVILGALRDPLPAEDVEQEPLFRDRLTILARPGHPLLSAPTISLESMARQPWTVPRHGTPSRDQFDALFTSHGLPHPESVLECGSILLMRELLSRGDLLGCISERQAAAEIDKGLLARLEIPFEWPARAIGLSYRTGWIPTTAQRLLLDMIRAAAVELTPL